MTESKNTESNTKGMAGGIPLFAAICAAAGALMLRARRKDSNRE